MADQAAAAPDTFGPQRAISWYEEGKTDRAAFETTWKAARRVFFPGSQDFVAQNDTQGKRDRNVAVDGHGILAANDLADYIVAAAANPQQKWITFEVEGELSPSPAGREWLEGTRDDILGDLHDPNSRFDEALKAAAKEYAVFANGPFYTGDRPGKLPVYMPVPLASAVWELDTDGELLRFGWKCRWTARQAVDKWPGKVSSKIEEAAKVETGNATRREFLHVMDRNPAFVPGSDVPRERQYRVRWIECDGAHVISTSYLEESCYSIFAALPQPGEAYGRGCGDNALEDTQMAQRVRVSTIRGMEKAVDPITIVPDDGVVSLPTNEARGLLVVRSELMRNGNVPVQTLRYEGRPDLGLEVSKILHEAIDRHFYTHYTRLPREPRMPTQQIIGLQEEQMRALGPLLTSFQRPLGQIVMRTYNIRRRDGRLRPLPPEWQDRDIKLKLKLEPPALRQMRLAEVRAFIQWLEIVGMATQVEPGVAHVPNLITAIAEVGSVLGVPQRWINSADQVQQMLGTQRQVAEDQAATEQALDATTAAKNIAPLLKVLQGSRENAGTPAMAAA